MFAPAQTIAEPQSPPETLWGLVVSLGFWLLLVVSAVLFAVVALSPKALSYLRLRNQYDTNQLQLVALERLAGQLERVIEAIQSDRLFAAEMTRIELDAIQPGEEVLPVDDTLKLDAMAARIREQTPVAAYPWYEPFVNQLSTDTRLRSILLLTAAVMAVISFSLLRPLGTESRFLATEEGDSVWRSLRNRYVRRPG